MTDDLTDVFEQRGDGRLQSIDEPSIAELMARLREEVQVVSDAHERDELTDGRSGDA